MAVDLKQVKINKDLLFNVTLVNDEKLVKELIKKSYPRYKISKEFFFIINKYIDIDNKKEYKYPGLIVRTNINEYAILYLEGTSIDEILAMNIIHDYLVDINDIKVKDINITKFEITKDLFFKVYSKNRE